jgi:hypothetical protein
MSYVDDNLLPGEQVVHRGVTHWFVFVPGSVFLALAFLNISPAS